MARMKMDNGNSKSRIKVWGSLLPKSVCRVLGIARERKFSFYYGFRVANETT